MRFFAEFPQMKISRKKIRFITRDKSLSQKIETSLSIYCKTPASANKPAHTIYGMISFLIVLVRIACASPSFQQFSKPLY